jgi:3-oxoacyl-[acyl-carrier protein] reductase
MDLGITGRVAIVGGASKGLGLATATALAREGADVTIFARTEDELRQAAAGIESATGRRVLPVVADATLPGDLERVVESTLSTFGRLDIAVNNAGGPPLGTFDSFTDEHWRQAFELSLLSVIRMTRLVAVPMREQHWGRVVNIASYAIREPAPNLILSNTVRMGLIGLAKSLAAEFAPDVLVNNLAPGRIATDRMQHLNALRAKNTGLPLAEIEAKVAGEIPLGRLGRPDEFADAAVFLASDRASYINGQTILCDGGLVRGI